MAATDEPISSPEEHKMEVRVNDVVQLKEERRIREATVVAIDRTHQRVALRFVENDAEVELSWTRFRRHLVRCSDAPEDAKARGSIASIIDMVSSFVMPLDETERACKESAIPLKALMSRARTRAETERVRIIHVSDTHGMLHRRQLYDFPSGDVLIHTGDFTRHGRTTEIEHFNELLKDAREMYLDVVVIVGNHDVKDKDDNYPRRAVTETQSLLTNATFAPVFSIVTLKCGLRLYACPYLPDSIQCPQPPSGDFDILISHGPPHGVLDEGKRVEGNHWGSKALRAIVGQHQPSLHLFGHMDECYGTAKLGRTLCVNSAMRNRWGARDMRNLRYGPHLVELTRRVGGPWKHKAVALPIERTEVRIVHVSDTRKCFTRQAVEALPAADVLVHSGDFSTTGSKADIIIFDQLLGEARKKYDDIVVVLGRHDVKGGLELEEIRALLTHATHVAVNEAVTLRSGLRVYGWSATRSSDAEVDADADVFVSHRPPYSVLDEAEGGDGNHWGSRTIRKAVLQACPLAHLFGFIHEQNGVSCLGDTLCVNSAMRGRLGHPHIITCVKKHDEWIATADRVEPNCSTT